MNLTSNQDHSGVGRRCLITVVCAFIAIHLLLAVLDFYHPAGFLRADRAVMRMSEITRVLGGEYWPFVKAFLGSHGVIGDYGAHAILYAIAGRPGVILCQLALLLASGFAVFRLAGLLGMSPKLQAISMGLYLALPHSLVFAHQLATEALHVPMLVISTWLICESIRKNDIWLAVISALSLGLATLIRPITLLWPIVVAGVAILLRRRRLGVTFVAVSYVPVLLWMSFIWQETGSFGLGESNHSLSRNLYLRVASIALTMPKAEAADVERQYLNRGEFGRMGAIEYAEFALHYPLPFMAEALRDAAIFLGKSGVERLTVDYFASDAQFLALTNTESGWRQHLDTADLMTNLRYSWSELGAILFISLAGSVLILAMNVLASCGAVSLVRGMNDQPDTATRNFTAILLIILPIYIFLFSLVVVTLQSRQRAPAEFALVLLAVYGAQKLPSFRGILKRFSPVRPGSVSPTR